jgi:hypothetical protein
MSIPGDNGAPVDSVNRPAFGYILNSLCVIISGIKMYRKLPSFLTMRTGNTIDVEMINGEDSQEINLELDESHKKRGG